MGNRIESGGDNDVNETTSSDKREGHQKEEVM